jgi:hypothetical protein
MCEALEESRDPRTIYPVQSLEGLNAAVRNERPQTLVMVLRKDCQFCSASSAFYRRLLEETTRLHVPVIAALPDEPVASQEYLRHLGIAVPEVRHASLHSVGVGATPTLVLVDARGTVARSWVGQLSAAREAEVFRSLQP